MRVVKLFVGRDRPLWPAAPKRASERRYLGRLICLAKEGRLMRDWEPMRDWDMKLALAVVFISCGVLVVIALHSLTTDKACTRSVPVIVGKTVTLQCVEHK